MWPIRSWILLGGLVVGAALGVNAYADRVGSLATISPSHEGPVMADQGPAYRQIEPSDSIAKHYSKLSDLSFAIASVPDPRVPRHRRAYDISVVALIQGMLDKGYALDRYVFPWEAALEQTDHQSFVTDDCKFGVMVFRKDRWRAQGTDKAASLRVLYIVPETTTYGLPRGTTLSAIREIQAQVSGPTRELPKGICETGASDENKMPADASALEHQTDSTLEGLYAKEAICKEKLLLLGPNFSGSLDSIAQINQTAAGLGLPKICAVSAAATAASNVRVSTSAAGLEYHGLAKTDEAKLAALWKLAVGIDAAEPGKIAILSETSVFGHEICPPEPAKTTFSGDVVASDDAKKRSALCRFAIKVTFASNIADVRARLRSLSQAHPAALAAMVPNSNFLPLDDGTGRGSELPDSIQSKLTSAGTEIELRKAIRMLGILQPKLVIVVATDVRDRLFLFDLLREGVPSAQLVDLETDVLMLHPEYIHATRGAVLVASTRLTSNDLTEDGEIPTLAVASTDFQVILRRAVGQIVDPDGGDARDSAAELPDCNAGQERYDVSANGPILHVVGNIGLVALSCVSRQDQLLKTLAVPLMAVVAVWLVMAASPSMQSLLGRETVRGTLSERFCKALRTWIKSSDPAINTSALRLLASSLLLLAAAYLAGGRSTFVFGLIALPILGWALAYQAGAYELSNTPLGPVPLPYKVLNRACRHLLSLIAIILFATMVGWLLSREIADDVFTNVVIAKLAYDAEQGMAAGVAMLIAIFALIFSDNALAVARGASARNRFVLNEGLGLDPRTSHFRAQSNALFAVGVFPKSNIMAIGSLALVICVATALPLKVTVYGEFVSAVALVAVSLLSLLALSFFANAVRLRQRALRISSLVRMAALKSGAEEADSPGLWPPSDTAYVTFASTPAVARIKDAGEMTSDFLSPEGWPPFAKCISGLLGRLPLRADTRIALYVLFASEVSQVRWATFSSVACSLAVAAFIYLFPVSGANGFALFSIGILILAGLFAGYTAMSFERDKGMSNILCNRTEKIELSATLFSYTAFPFIILAVCLAIVQVPGVLDWSEGIFRSLLTFTGGGLWKSAQ